MMLEGLRMEDVNRSSYTRGLILKMKVRGDDLLT
jgi:hypothetical protein